MIFDEFSQDSKRATVKTLLAISELCNSLILNDLTDGTNLLEDIDPKEMFNGEKLLDSIKRSSGKRATEYDEELDKMADEIFNKPRKTTKNTNSKNHTKTLKSDEEKLHLANDNDGEGDEWVCNEPSTKPDTDEGRIFNSTYIPITEMSESFTNPVRDTEPVDDGVISPCEQDEYYDKPLMAEVDDSFTVKEIPAEAEEDFVDEETSILKFNPLVFKDEPNQMFLGLDENDESFTWDMETYGNIVLLGDTIGSESKVGKLLADYAFNNKKSVELKILNPDVGNTSYLNYRTGEKSVSPNLKSVLKTLKDTSEIMLSRYEEYDKRGNNTINNLRNEHSRIIIWVEEMNSYIPLTTDTPMAIQTKKEIFEYLTSIIRMGRTAKINTVLKSSQNLSYMLDMEEENFELPTPITLYSKDSLYNNQIEIPQTPSTTQKWINTENNISNEILVYADKGFEIINLMESHRTSAP